VLRKEFASRVFAPRAKAVQPQQVQQRLAPRTPLDKLPLELRFALSNALLAGLIALRYFNLVYSAKDNLALGGQSNQRTTVATILNRRATQSPHLLLDALCQRKEDEFSARRGTAGHVDLLRLAKVERCALLKLAILVLD
jgi:hypothetical protein